MKGRKVIPMVVFYILIVSFFLGSAYLGSAVTSAVVQRIPVDRAHTIVIDPGHGGEDGGAVSISGRPESGYNLEIALRLNDLLHLLGYRTKMIRTRDQAVYTKGTTLSEKKVSDLKQRVQTVNDTEGAILVSIHQNIFSDSRYGGAQVFYGPEGEGQALAEQLQESFCQTLNPGSNRKSKKADGIYLMQHIRCTGILVECGFLSNPQEEALLQTEEYQQKLSCVIAGTLSEFLTEASMPDIMDAKG